jgi:protein-S-isoprenylcysteine O-methyltransferase Ste14
MKVLMYFSFAFLFSELLLLLIKRSKSHSVKIRNDKGSLIILWLVITTGFTGSFFFANYGDFTEMERFFRGFGFVFLVVGLVVRWVAILHLGKLFTVDVSITDSAVLKTNGLYERVRHPSYLGLLLLLAGFSLQMGSAWSFLILVIPVFIAITYRISVEEKLLISEFGDSYRDYKSKTKRLIPGIF